MIDTKICGICNSSACYYLLRAKGYDIFKCSACEFCQVAEPPQEGCLDKIYEDLHIKHSKFRDAQAAIKENQSRLRYVEQHLPLGSTILDAGCAAGDFLTLAKDRYIVHGVDTSEGAIEEAKARLPEISGNLRAEKLEHLSQDWRRFDAVCLWDVIEHVRDPAAVSQEIFSMLKPGGYLFLSTPDIGSLTARLMKRHWAFMIPPLHLCYFSRKSFDYLFHKRLQVKILEQHTRGKWTSLAFIFYKLGQINQWFAPTWLLNFLSKSRLGHLNIYVPSNDIFYMTIRKPHDQDRVV